MSDDIVTRLRQQESEWSFDEPVRICLEAADEIERLRVALKMSETRANRWRDRALKAEGRA